MADRQLSGTWVGITGHRHLGPDPGTPARVRAECRRILTDLGGPVVAVSGLAIGADTLFAEVALELGLPLVGVIPFVGYADDFDATDRDRFNALLGRCTQVERLPFRERSESAYMAAGVWTVDRSDRLVAIWDGKPAAGLGGTGDVVAYALERGIPVVQVVVDR